MVNIYNDTKAICRLLKSKLFAISVIVLFALGITISYVFCNSKVVHIFDGMKQHRVFTVSQNPHEILAMAGVSVRSEDALHMTPNGTNTVKLVVQRSFPVEVSAAGKTQTVYLAGGTVADAVALTDFDLDEDDLYTPSLEEKLTVSSSVQVDIVDYVEYTEIENIPHGTVEEETDTLKKGTTKVKTEGVDGVVYHSYLAKLVNGVIVETTSLEEYVSEEMVEEKILVGNASSAKKVSAAAGKTSSSVQAISPLKPDSPIQLDQNGNPLHYKRKIEGKATAYSPEDGDTTATGHPAQVGLVAVNPKQIPYGSRLYIKTPSGNIIYGYAIAADTGGFVKKGRVTVDLFFNSKEECIEFGIRDVEIYVLS